MGETLGHLVFLFIGILIGAMFLFLFCFIGGQCRFLSSGYGTPQSNLTCSLQASACNCTTQGGGTTTTTCSQKGSSCNSDSDCCSGLACNDGKCVPSCINSPNCTGSNCCPSTTAVACGLSGYTPCYSNNDCCSGLVCQDGVCRNNSVLLCSQVVPASSADCHRASCPSRGSCRYVAAVHNLMDSRSPIVRNASCVCDTCNSTNENSPWVQGSCSNGTVTYSNYCIPNGYLNESLCKMYNLASYPNGTTQQLYADFGIDDAIAHGATILGAYETSDIPGTLYIGACYWVTNNCSWFEYNPNSVCRNGACVNLACKTSGSCSSNSDCCSGYQCINGSCSPVQTQTCDDTHLSCTNNSDCCPGDYCHYDNTCHSYSCNSLGASCEANSECCSPYACVNGYCSIPSTCQTSGRCNTDTDCCHYSYCNSNYYCAACQTAGACTKNSQCCSGYCSSSGICSYTACKDIGGACTNNSDCCHGIFCNNGTCNGCLSTSNNCNSNSQCCSGYCLGDNTCGTQACKGQGGACSGVTDCCSGFQCFGGICTACQKSGSCRNSGDCCYGYFCPSDTSNPVCTPFE